LAQDTGQVLELAERHLAQRDGQAQFLEAVEQVLGTLARTAAPSGGVANLLQGEQRVQGRSEEHTSELQSLMRNSYAVFCLKKQKNRNKKKTTLYTKHNR